MVDVDLNVDTLVGCSPGNDSIFEKGPCWWWELEDAFFRRGFFWGESRVFLIIARVPDDSNVCYCFCSRCLEILWKVVVNCWKPFCPQKFNLCSSCRTRLSITCITRIQICIFSDSGAFCILSNSVTRNEIVSIGAFPDNYLNRMIYSDCRRMWFGNCWNPIGR